MAPALTPRPRLRRRGLGRIPHRNRSYEGEQEAVIDAEGLGRAFAGTRKRSPLHAPYLIARFLSKVSGQGRSKIPAHRRQAHRKRNSPPAALISEPPFGLRP